MKTKVILIMMFVVAGFVVPGWAEFRTVGIYDPNADEDPGTVHHFNDVDQSCVYDSNTPGIRGYTADANNVIDLAYMQANILTAFNANMGGVVDLEGIGDALEDDPPYADTDGGKGHNTIRAKYGIGQGKMLEFVHANGNIELAEGIEDEGDYAGQVPISGNHRFERAGRHYYIYRIYGITNGVEGERVIVFGATFLDPTDDSANITVTATFSDGSTVTSIAPLGSGTGAEKDQDAFFGFIAPAGEYITTLVCRSTGSHLDMDDLAFITSDDFPPSSNAGPDQIVQLYDASGVGITLAGSVDLEIVEDYTYTWSGNFVTIDENGTTGADDAIVTFATTGTYVLTLNVTGSVSGALYSDTVNIEVVERSANAGDDQTVQVYDVNDLGNGVDLAGSVDDPYGETYTYTWSGDFTGIDQNGNADANDANVDFTTVGSYDLELVVTGSTTGASAPDTVTINVVEPVLDAGGYLSVTKSRAAAGFKLGATIYDPYPAENYVYDWDGGWSTIDNDALADPTVTFTALGDYTLTLTADPDGDPSAILGDSLYIRVTEDPVLVTHFAIDPNEYIGGYLDSSTEGDPNNHFYVMDSMGQVEQADGAVGCDVNGAIDMDDVTVEDPDGIELHLNHVDPNTDFNDNLPHLDNLSEGVTVALWVNLDHHGSQNQCLVDKKDSFRFTVDAAGYLKTYLWVDGNNDPCQINSNDGSDLGYNLDDNGLEISREEWHHIAFTYDAFSGMVYQFLDGAQIRASSLDFGITLNVNTNSLYLGSDADGGNKTDGEFDDIRIYNYELLPYEIVELASMGDSAAMVYAGSDVSVNPNALPYQLQGAYINLGQGGNKVTPGNEAGEFFASWEERGSDPNKPTTIADAGDPESTVTFVAPGEYTFRLTSRERDIICDTDNEVYDEVTITIEAATDCAGYLALGGANVADIAGNDCVVNLKDLALVADKWGLAAP